MLIFQGVIGCWLVDSYFFLNESGGVQTTEGLDG